MATPVAPIGSRTTLPRRTVMPPREEPGFDVAVVQDASVVLDREASLEKTITLAREAARTGAKLVLFPEAFIPGYPRGLSFGATVGNRSAEGRALFRRYAENAITVPGPETEQLSATAAELGIHLAVGVIERDAVTAGTLYCTLLLWGPDGTLLNQHRKLKPTASERLLWGEGDGSGLQVVPTELGGIGGLICWENLMPLARTALYQHGVELYLAPTADARETWQATIRHIAQEGRCYVLSCNQFVTKADYPDDLGKASQRELADAPDPLCRGGSAIVGPLGEYVAGPLWDEAGILYGHIDPGAIVEARFDFDAVGHYSRPDLFHLSVNPAAEAAFPTWDEIEALDDFIFGGPAPFPFLDAMANAPEPFFGPPDDDDLDPFFPTFPAQWSEKKPDWSPAKPVKRRRKK
jgi:nitrilase